jgi:hypothetical protein
MFFTRTHHFNFPVSKEDLKNRLIGKHVKIHNLDFEVQEEDNKLSIVPHAEQVDAIKTLPVTTVDMREDGGKTKVVVTSKLRQFDSGGPMLVLIFCIFMFAASIVLLYVGNEPLITYTLLGISVFIFTVFWIRMETGYFDYVRKIRAYVKSKGEPAAAGVSTTVVAV